MQSPCHQFINSGKKGQVPQASFRSPKSLPMRIDPNPTVKLRLAPAGVVRDQPTCWTQ
jgi:hypothetical protein